MHKMIYYCIFTVQALSEMWVGPIVFTETIPNNSSGTICQSMVLNAEQTLQRALVTSEDILDCHNEGMERQLTFSGKAQGCC